MSNLSEAETALSKISSVNETVAEIAGQLSKQINLIPLTDGAQDELGENTSSYINEIKNKIQSGITDQLNSTLGKSDSIKKKAKEMDDAAATSGDNNQGDNQENNQGNNLEGKVIINNN